MRHHHKWDLVSKEFVNPIADSPGEASGSTDQLRIFQQMLQGYWSYVFRCPCGETKVERS